MMTIAVGTRPHMVNTDGDMPMAIVRVGRSQEALALNTEVNAEHHTRTPMTLPLIARNTDDATTDRKEHR